MNKSTSRITLTAMMMACVFVVTRFIQIPIPLGYFNIGNSVILLFCLLIPGPYGILGGSIGSALADLTSYPAYTIPTLIIKAIMPALFYVIAGWFKNKKVGYIVATAVSTLVPLFGYTIVGGFFYGGFFAGLAQFPGLFLEYVANLVIFAIVYRPLLSATARFRGDLI